MSESINSFENHLFNCIALIEGKTVIRLHRVAMVTRSGAERGGLGGLNKAMGFITFKGVGNKYNKPETLGFL